MTEVGDVVTTVTLLFPLSQLPTPREPLTNHPGVQTECVNLAAKCPPSWTKLAR